MKSQKTTGVALILLVILILTLALAGCNKEEALDERKPDKTHNVFLLFDEEFINDNNNSIGDLYIKSEGKDKEKISSKVADGSYEFINSQNKVLFMNDENELYEFNMGKEKVKLAKDVISFKGDYSEDIVTFQKEDGDLYIIHGEGENEKIASSVMQYAIVGDYIYFVDEDGDFSMYNSKDKQETEIASDVTYFTDLNHDDEVAYLDEDLALFFKKIGDEDSIKITSDEVSSLSIKKVGDNLIYLNIEDGDSAELYQSPIAEGGKSTKIASDIRYYKYSDGNFYYVNNDDNLYKKKESDEASTKLASDVWEFKIKKGSIVYLDVDNKLFTLKDEKKPEKMASSVSDYDVTPNGDIVYTTEDKDLFVNSKKISSDIQGYKHFYGNVAFATKDDKLYLMEDMGEKKLVEGDLNQFSNASYQNKIIYVNDLTFEDINGVWKSENTDREGPYYLGIDKDGDFSYLLAGETVELELDYSGYHTLNASAAGTDFRFEIGKDQTLKITIDDRTETYTKSTKAEADEYVKKLELEADKEEISYLMDNYISNFTNAVNYGNENYITRYISPESGLYQQQIDFVQNAYENDIREYLEDNEIESITNTGEDVYVVNTFESFTIYEGYESSSVKKDFKNSYTVKKIDGEFLITDLKVTQSNTGSL